MSLREKILEDKEKFREKLTRFIKEYGKIAFNPPIDLDGEYVLTEIDNDGVCILMDEFGNDSEVEINGLDLMDLAIVLDEITGMGFPI